MVYYLTYKEVPKFDFGIGVGFNSMGDINVPVLNIGPNGLNAHKKLERMEMKYSLEIVPNITNLVIQNP
ncbi:hypothetical protein CD31_17035 [Lysinibacillus boronitolerans JCM 21713 = 10a = NBRC 103108]|uniref:Peptidase M20 dimerisation domain-containing protein n=1 Tax=Lysinibacillus boronitolerans JCM 21713 = 10a = NBRC 103108 TaxID=1294264 RepID=A0ABR4XWH6_9BACI|nr:hypothetical protein CD31_17035 [Lysinibacillus boronitolerans JCM 21713 = 10a = NBRC 103108]